MFATRSRILATFLCVCVTLPLTIADEKVTPTPVPDTIAEPSVPGEEDRPVPLAPLSDKLAAMLSAGHPLNPEKTVVLDKSRQRLLLRTQVACVDCLLEMLCCTEQTKEHESLLWFRGQAAVVHAGLLALGAKPGTPATFSPEFKPPTGQKLDIFVNWTDENGKLHREDARSWMRTSVSHYFSEPLLQSPPGIKLPLMELRYDPYNKEILWFGQMSDQQREKLLTLCDDKTYQAAIEKFYKESQPREMDASFVFAGSYHFSREEGGPKFYAADEGYLVCVANFAASLIDVQEASSASDGGQAFEGWPGRVPPRGTAVIMEIAAATQEKPVAKPVTPAAE
jgi:hypothetical protein